MRRAIKVLVWTMIIMLSFPVFSAETHEAGSKESSSSAEVLHMIMHHIKDAHEWHILTYTNSEGNKQDVVVSLPVILIDGGVKFFSSSTLYDEGQPYEYTTSKGKVVHYIENEELGYGICDETIYKLGDNGHLQFDPEGKVTSVEPLDLSITKNVFTVLFSALLIFLFCRAAARTYKKGEVHAPRGLAKFVEPFVVYVRDEIALENIGEKKYKRYLPYLLTIFFFIWINNMLGIIPIIPGGANLVGNVAFTGILAIFTFVLTIFSGNKNYWKHIFAMPGVPKVLLIIMIPIEIIGMFTKPFALTVRLFANMIAGHIILLSLVGLIFIFGSIYWAALAVPMGLFMSTLELLVALIQAYIFTMLSALFIGEAVKEGH